MKIFYIFKQKLCLFQINTYHPMTFHLELLLELDEFKESMCPKDLQRLGMSSQSLCMYFQRSQFWKRQLCQLMEISFHTAQFDFETSGIHVEQWSLQSKENKIQTFSNQYNDSIMYYSILLPPLYDMSVSSCHLSIWERIQRWCFPQSSSNNNHTQTRAMIFKEKNGDWSVSWTIRYVEVLFHHVPSAYRHEDSLLPCCSIGLSPLDEFLFLQKNHMMLGWTECIGFHSDDGKIYHDSFTIGKTTPLESNDVIGIGVDLCNQTAFFTKNGHEIATFWLPQFDCTKLLYPCMIYDDDRFDVEINLGTKPFCFSFPDTKK